MAALQCVAKFGTKSTFIEKIILNKQHLAPFRNTCTYVLRTRLIACDQVPFPRNTTKPVYSKYFHVSIPGFGKIVQFNLSDIGEGIREVSVKEWYVKVGDSVAQFDKICEVQSDKASVTITSRYDGIIKKLYHDVDGVALVGQPLIDIEVVENGSQDQDNSINKITEPLPKVDNDLSQKSTQFTRTFATPAVRRIAAENQIKLCDISGSGKNGRVLKEDIFTFLNKGKVESVHSDSLKQKNPPGNSVIRIQGFQRAMVKTMTAAQKIPHLGYCDEIDMSQLVALCSRLKVTSAARGVRITYMPFFIKAASNALKQYPIINSSVDEKCENVILKSSHNIGVAMDTSNGLVVPNLKNVEELSIYQIAVELNRLRKSGAEGKLGVNDLTGGTLTLSNIGAIGGTYCSPLILSPEVAIAALGKVQILPRFDSEDELVKAHVMAISWSADHRIVDGATIARFSNVWKEYIEKPDLLMLGL